MAHRILITGSGGFAGRALCSHLMEKGHEVFGCELYIPSTAVNHFKCDMTVPAQVAATLEWAGPITHVIHMAAITFVPSARQDPRQVMEVNLQGTLNLTEALHAHAPEARLIFVSSSEVYGIPQTLPTTEEHPLEPANPYAISKAAGDQYCRFLARNGATDAVIMRPFNHSGAGQSDLFVLSSFANQIARIEAGEEAPVLSVGNLEAKRDFLHVDDVLRAYELILDKGGTGEVYNVCSGASQTIQSALDTLLGWAKVDIEVKQNPARMRPADIPETLGSHEKLTKATGWQPEIPFDKILEDLLAYWRDYEEAR